MSRAIAELEAEVEAALKAYSAYASAANAYASAANAEWSAWNAARDALAKAKGREHLAFYSTCAVARESDGAPPAMCLARKVGSDEPLTRCKQYPRCPCGGPEGWPSAGGPQK